MNTELYINLIHRSNSLHRKKVRYTRKHRKKMEIKRKEEEEEKEKKENKNNTKPIVKIVHIRNNNYKKCSNNMQCLLMYSLLI